MSASLLTFAVLASLVVGAALYAVVALLWSELSRSDRLPLALAALVGVGLLVACAAPPLHYSDSHGIWLEQVKRGGF